MRTARGVRRALRRDPREAEKPRAIRGTTGPFGRVFGAAWRGAKFAREEARRQREAHERASGVPVGVCRRCGAVAAKTALVWALTRFGRQEQMCAKCRAAVEAERKADEEAAEPATAPEPDVADGDVVEEPARAITQPDTADAPHTPDSGGSYIPPAPPFQAEPPAPEPDTHTTWTVQRVDNTPAQPAHAPSVESAERPALNTAPEGEGMPRQLMPRAGGALATRNTAMTRRGGGDSYTHGQWNRSTADLHRRLEMLPALLEAMLASLNHADAGRTQVAGVMAFREGAVLFMEEIREMLRDVNRREMPVVEAVTHAGGPEEIPSIHYLSDV
jgi:hypothetical protein